VGGRKSLHNEGNQVKENEIGGTCSIHGRHEKCIQNFSRIIEERKSTRGRGKLVLTKLDVRTWTRVI